MRYLDDGNFSVGACNLPAMRPVRVVCTACGAESVRQLRAALTKVGRRKLVPVVCDECGRVTLVEPPRWEG